MTTLHIRDVSDDVAATLKERAAGEGKSLSAYVAAELAKIAARPTIEQIVVRLKARDPAHPGRDHRCGAGRPPVLLLGSVLTSTPWAGFSALRGRGSCRGGLERRRSGG